MCTGGRLSGTLSGCAKGALTKVTGAVFGEKQLVDLTLAIALMNAYNRMAISFRATPMALAR
jgi:alkylhydroperoxidase family enzyme